MAPCSPIWPLVSLFWPPVAPHSPFWPLLASCDLFKAFDQILWSTLIDHIQSMDLPLRLKWALIQELCVIRHVYFVVYGRHTFDLHILRGLIQGNPGAAFVFFLGH